MRIGYEMVDNDNDMAIIFSYPTRTRGIIVLLKTHTKYQEFLPTLLTKATDFQLVFNFEQMRAVTMLGSMV